MLTNAFRDDVIKGIYDYLASKIDKSYYMSNDKTTIIRTFNLNYRTPELVHHIYSKEDISLCDFLFKVDVYIYNEDPIKCTHYCKWASITELWSGGWRKISQEEFYEFRAKIENKFREFNENEKEEAPEFTAI